MPSPAYAPSSPKRTRELTVRGIILGGVITLVFTAANVYMGLKAGLTFATSIPAAVISMAVINRFKNHSIVENNIVQTIASAAGTLSAIIFVLPGLVMIGWWQGFPYWTTVAVCAIGGILGVMYSIPLRRALVTTSDLPYPEGIAAAEVLKVGDSEKGSSHNRLGMRAIVVGGLASAGFSLLTNLKIAAAEVTAALKAGPFATWIGAGASMGLLGVGHLVGLSVGISMVVGVALSFGVLLPTLVWGDETATASEEAVRSVFIDQVRFIGAGVIAIASVWTLIKILKPIAVGIREAAIAAGKRHAGKKVDLTERDIPIQIVGAAIALLMLPIGFLLADFVNGTAIRNSTRLMVVSVAFILLIGLVVAAVCGYMAGLIGSSNSPISGVGILVVLVGALAVKLAYGPADGSETKALIAFTLFTAAVVFGISTISNDNLQDLKTGQLVGATPWKQQVALVIGVLFGSVVIAPVLGLLQSTFGFAGTPGAKDNALNAPQASIISKLAKGIFDNSLDWTYIGWGAFIGIVVIVVDETLKRGTAGRLKLPPLAVGMGMYLMPTTTLTIALGAVLVRRVGGTLRRRRRRQKAHGGAHEHRADRRRIPFRRGLRGNRRLVGRRRSPCRRRRRVRDARKVHRAGAVRGRRHASVQARARAGREVISGRRACA